MTNYLQTGRGQGHMVTSFYFYKQAVGYITCKRYNKWTSLQCNS